MKKIVNKIQYISIICILLCLSLLGCKGNNKPDNNYIFGEYSVHYGDINLHLDSTCTSNFGEKINIGMNT